MASSLSVQPFSQRLMERPKVIENGINYRGVKFTWLITIGKTILNLKRALLKGIDQLAIHLMQVSFCLLGCFLNPNREHRLPTLRYVHPSLQSKFRLNPLVMVFLMQSMTYIFFLAVSQSCSLTQTLIGCLQFCRFFASFWHIP